MASCWAVIGVGFVLSVAAQFGLGITGMSRDVSWGFYIAQLHLPGGCGRRWCDGGAAYYLHDYKAFGRITVLGEFLAIAAIVMCLLSIVVDLGQPMRA
jgi:Ni/Fe-hydrogenase subunit HybB-like protein